MTTPSETDQMPANQAPFPATRFRRARASASLRDLVRETEISVNDLIWPVFVRDGDGVEEPVASMPGVVRRSVDRIVEAAREAMPGPESGTAAVSTRSSTTSDSERSRIRAADRLHSRASGSAPSDE